MVQLSLFDGWLRFAAVHYADASFIGRADDDSVINLSWLHAALAAEAARLAHVPPARRRVYAGSFQWFHWDEEAFVPRGWGMGPWNARRTGARDESAFCPRCCNVTYTPRCSGPFPFATGPLLLLSGALARWYRDSDAVRHAVRRALDSRLNRSRGDALGPLPLPQARKRGLFLQPTDAGDMKVRLFDDVFLGHALCMGGVRNVTLLAFPFGTRADVSCNGHGRRGTSGCDHSLAQFNWTSPRGLPYVLHNVKMASEVEHAASLVSAVAVGAQAASCGTLRVPNAGLACGHDWTWCGTPWEAPPRTGRRRRVNKPGAGG